MLEPCRPAGRRGGVFWAVVVAAALFMSLEPGLFLVVLAVGLSLVALASVLLVLRLLALDILGQSPDAPPPIGAPETGERRAEHEAAAR